MSAGASSTLTELGRDECLRLLSATTVGRVVVVRPVEDLPVIRPVNYAFDEASQSVVFRCRPGTKFASLMSASRAWFEVDDIDPGRRTGWSVIVAGVTEVVTHPTEVRRLETIGVDSWIAGEDGEWVRIRARVVSGRRLSATVGVTERER
ncbi:MAG TPA: pyridoxamine 5'-phosphate oxidase family protein [Solirubrobacteraceae bacterium]|jgi:nitroimidazol reductase NimA-like FMN-containing flavoprotein (pyridoxamine 5'-phosphate oxidase superfamily)